MPKTQYSLHVVRFLDRPAMAAGHACYRREVSGPRDIPGNRVDEYRSLVELLMEHAAIRDNQTQRTAEWIASSALEPGHLWRSMGVESRDEVRRIMRTHFPALEAENDKDMRWKKFLYKRMCGWSGFSA